MDDEISEAANDMLHQQIQSMPGREVARAAFWMLGWMTGAQPEALIAAITAWYQLGAKE